MVRSQVIHVLRKDVRHHWPEITIAIALLAIFVWVEPRTWTGFELSPGTQILAAEIGQLVTIAWAFLIVRLVQGESLVGDRQFWLTRPYEWKKLLVEKLIFAVVFVNGPLLIADAVLLKEAGFRPTSFVYQGLWLQLLWVLFLILPAVTLGTITSGIGQAVLVVLDGIACLVAFAALTSGSGVELGQEHSIGNVIGVWVAFGAIVSVIVWQYARRRTMWARALLAGALVAALLIAFLVTPGEKAIARVYPSASAARAPVQFAFDAQKQDWQDTGYAEKGKVDIGIPLNVSGINQDTVIIVNGTSLMIEGPGGKQWNSGWQSGLTLFANYRHTQTDFGIDKAVYDGLKSIPVKARISFALTELREKDSVRIAAQAGEFGVPWNGHCSLAPNAEMVCLFPLATPALLLHVQQQDLTCTPPPKVPPLPEGSTGYAVTAYSNTGRAEFGISPVQVSQLGTWDWGGGWSDQTSFAHRGVCPGTQMEIGRLSEVRSMRTEIVIDPIRLADYELKRGWAGAGGWGFSISLR